MTKNKHDHVYAQNIRAILNHGIRKEDRTGVGTISLFSRIMRFDMQDGFPLLTLKKTPFRWLAEEMLWFRAGGRPEEGGMNNNDLLDKGVDIWSPWAGSDGSLGPVYGYQWRHWPKYEEWPSGEVYRTGEFDQLAEAQDKLRNKPDDRRIIVSAWNVAQIDGMALPPCHLMMQFYSRPTEQGRMLDMMMYQRSCDMFIGVPFNIAQYALMLHMMAKTTGHEPGVLNWVGGDCHLYLNQIDAAEQMLAREPYAPPTLALDGADEIDDFTYESMHLEGYRSHPAIRVEVAV